MFLFSVYFEFIFFEMLDVFRVVEVFGFCLFRKVLERRVTFILFLFKNFRFN